MPGVLLGVYFVSVASVVAGSAGLTVSSSALFTVRIYSEESTLLCLLILIGVKIDMVMPFVKDYCLSGQQQSLR